MKQKIISILTLLLMAATGAWAEDEGTTYKDPEGRVIEDSAVTTWLKKNGFTQADIDALGNDANATNRLYECYLFNCNLRIENTPSNSLSITAIEVIEDVVYVTVKLVRKAPLQGAINGILYFYGTANLADGFGRSPIADESISFSDGDPFFDTTSTTEFVTQTATATFDKNQVTAKFFKAAIEVPRVEQPEEPWEPEPDPEPDPEPEE